MTKPHQRSAVPRAALPKHNQNGRQVARRIAFKSLQDAHGEAFDRILREVIAERPRTRLPVVVRAFVAELRAELAWYEERSARYLARR
jgi:hypothetical protein